MSSLSYSRSANHVTASPNWPERNNVFELFSTGVAVMEDALSSANVRPKAPAWPAIFWIGDFEVELVDVDVARNRGTAWVDYREEAGDVTRVYASFADDGSMVQSLTLLAIEDEHDPDDVEYTLSDYSGFENTTDVDGRLAIWEDWEDSEETTSKGTRLVWDASPTAYGWLQSRTLTIDELKKIASQSTVTDSEAVWDDPSLGMKMISRGVAATEAEDFVRPRDGKVASFDIEVKTGEGDREYAEIEVHLLSALEGEIGAIRSLAFQETQVQVRGAAGYLLVMEPFSEYEDGTTYLVWAEDSETTGIATVDNKAFESALVEVTNSFDATRPYD